MEELVIFSPHLPSRNGIAEGSSILLPWHDGAYRCYLVLDDKAPDPIMVPSSVEVIRYADWKRSRHFFSRLRHLYHVGNNDEHEHIYHAACSVPGVVLLHDYVVHHLVHGMTLSQGDRRSYLALAEYEFGKPGALLAQQNLEGRGSYFYQNLMALSGPLIDSARGVVTYSNYAARRIRARRPDIPVKYVPHYAPHLPLNSAYRREEARADLNIPQDITVVASMGFAGKTKLVMEVLGAVEELVREGRRLRYIVGGQPEPELKLEETIKKLGLEECVKVTGYISEEEFFRIILASDVLANLRFPSCGEMSGPLIRAMLCGRPAIVSSTGAFRSLPDRAVYKVPAGRDVSAAVAQCIRHIQDNPLLHQEKSFNALEFAKTTFRTSETIRGIHETIEAAYGDGQAERETGAEHRLTFAFRTTSQHRRSLEQFALKPNALEMAPALLQSWAQFNRLPIVVAGQRLLVVAVDPEAVANTAIQLGLAKGQLDQLSLGDLEKKWDEIRSRVLARPGRRLVPEANDMPLYDVILMVLPVMSPGTDFQSRIATAINSLRIGGLLIVNMLGDTYQTDYPTSEVSDKPPPFLGEKLYTEHLSEHLRMMGLSDISISFESGTYSEGLTNLAHDSQICISAQKVTNLIVLTGGAGTYCSAAHATNSEAPGRSQTTAIRLGRRRYKVVKEQGAK